MAGKRICDSYSTLSELALPNDANGLGNVLGGKIMHLVDIAGSLAGARHTRGFVVTASFDQMDFLEPVHIGELITLHAAVNRVFRSSMEIGVKVFAENMHTAEVRHVASAYLTFVHLDKDRKPTAAPEAVPESDDEKRRFEEAGVRRKARLERRWKGA